jgi:lysozyme family protein
MPDAEIPVSPTAARRFAACLDEVLRQEGGYADNPVDPGGATNMGITRRTLAGWRGVSPWWSLPKTEVRALGRPEAAAVYRSLYWDRCNADALPAGLDLGLFDYAVNSGPDRAIKALQGELKVVADGFVGPLTLNALKTRIGLVGVAGLITALCDGRLSFLQRLAISATFGAGWSRRVAEIRAAALAMAGVAAPSPPQPQKGASPMNLNILAGYKTYLVGAVMLILGVAQLLGVSIPDFSGQSAGDLLMQGLAVIFLRQGITNTVAKG